MENASKALIIAGAILLSILIISLGIMIYNQASGVVNNNAMSEVEISAFNQKFTQFEGTNVKGSQVNSLLQQIVQSNVANQEDTSKQVTLDVTSGTAWQGDLPQKTQPTNATTKAQTGKTYKVECTLDTKTGLVTTVTISNSGS
jgi:hypothetical protein